MKGFRGFLLRGNVVDLAVGIVIGAAFTAIVTGFVAAFLTPIIGLISGTKGEFGSAVFTVDGVKFPYGTFVQAVISFVLVAAFIYFCVVLPVNKLTERFTPKKEPAVTTNCPECLSAVPLAATRCAFCTVQLAPPQGLPLQKPVHH